MATSTPSTGLPSAVSTPSTCVPLAPVVGVVGAEVGVVVCAAAGEGANHASRVTTMLPATTSARAVLDVSNKLPPGRSRRRSIRAQTRLRGTLGVPRNSSTDRNPPSSDCRRDQFPAAYGGGAAVWTPPGWSSRNGLAAAHL